ncbi:double-strand break repair protein AddB [Pseudotabrizicola sediminis]|uniref:Double-strand break repair protein AddB n=1 Tax=Pseudotabrizicola sediminis TaxID=2486418 RepID=A0ABY2KLA5_9RHOB|nr:PD-(D/E)XK nuclease family protein [Pseudotabrizicola sediminis]TGD43265.1 double-strand break repair protein AddB [Pseudotabrizicola sediminis]
MFSPEEPRLFAVPPGVDFPAAVVAGLRARLQGQPPEAMARVTLYLNTTRMRRRVVQLFGQQGAGFLPRIRLVTDLEPDIASPALPPAIPALRSKLQLTVLIGRLLDNLPDLAPRSALADLAESLSALMSEMQGEGVTPDRVAALDVSDHSEHWARTREFLTIIAPFFADDHQMDTEGRQRRLVLMLADLWSRTPPADPVIIAGSTGSRGTTALLMQAVARLPHGAIILPGYDFDMPEQVWQGLDDALTSEDHPQYRFRKLMALTGTAPADIRPWHDTAPPSAARNKVVSLALRPAPVTDQWLIEGPDLLDLTVAMEGTTLMEAASPRQEALSIALILRDAAERQVPAALISPDRVLTRQVAAALDRWGIRPDDSAGVPLNQSAPGRFLRHVVRLFGQKLTSDALLTMLKHPLTASSMDRGQHLLLSRDLELKLRREGPAFPTGPDLIAWAMVQRNAHALGWATALAGALDGLAEAGPVHLADHLARTRTLAERLSRGPAPEGTGRLWEEAAGEAALAFLTQLEAEAAHGGTLTPGEFRDLFEGLISGEEVRAPMIAHPGIMIWGTLEARVQGAELVILAGLNDGTWPALPPPDSWLNRKMRMDAGLLLPERRIGLSAHDFQQAIAATTVVLSRALRNAEAETVPSRWINRLTNLMAGLPDTNGPEALRQMRARGQLWLDRAAAMDRALPDPDAGLRPARRPSPCPPLTARPDALSLTRIEVLIRDPYAIYADKVLNLRPLDPIRQAPDARDRGTVVHEILECFARERPPQEDRDAAHARLMQITARVLDASVPWPAARALWAARMQRLASHFLTVDAAEGGETILVEGRGELVLQDLSFTLFGTPDRIDLLPGGKLHLIDYKTGSPPTEQAQKSFAKQLHLAALIAEDGGFKGLGPQQVAKITYVGLGSSGKVTEDEITEDKLAAVRDGLYHLIGSYTRLGQGYTSRRAVFTERFPGDYDHLARFGEWEMTDTPDPQPVGRGASHDA